MYMQTGSGSIVCILVEKEVRKESKSRSPDFNWHVSLAFSHLALLLFRSLLTLSIYLSIYQQSTHTTIQISKEGESFTVDVSVAKMSKLVESTIDEDDDDDDDEEQGQEIQLPNVKAVVLAKVIEYCEHYKLEEMTPITTPLKSSKIEDLVQTWYADYVKLEQVLLFELVTAANFMDIKPLLDLTCLAVSVMIKGKSAVELRSIFNLSNEFTPEEEAQVREENKWAEQPNSSNNNTTPGSS